MQSTANSAGLLELNFHSLSSSFLFPQKEDPLTTSSRSQESWTAPKFLEVFTDKELMVGESMSLKCTATGVPLPQVTWTLDGYVLDSLTNLRTGDYVTNDNYVVSFVNVTSVRGEHGGSYACTATSDSGSIVNTGVVRVPGDPVVRPMGNRTATAASDVAIKCPVGGHPIDDLFWEKGMSLTDWLLCCCYVCYYVCVWLSFA